MSTLSDAQKAKARRYLGAPDVSRQYDLRLESSLDALTSEGVTEVCELLDGLAGIEAKLTEARECRLGIVSVEDITFRGPDEVRVLWREGNRLAQMLGVALYFTPRRKPFGTSPASWSTEAGAAHVARRG